MLTPSAYAGAKAVLPPITRPFRLDLPALERLLRDAGLPASGLPEALDDYLVARSGERIVGAVGAEYRGAVALVRALAVAPAARGQGLGGALVEALVADARRMGTRYLLAPAGKAADYFARLGFGPLTDEARAAAEAAGVSTAAGYDLVRGLD
jgi:amino-acid N-acetyltransferase